MNVENRIMTTRCICPTYSFLFLFLACDAIPSSAVKCIQVLTEVYSDYDMTLFPNTVGDVDTAAALTRFDNLPDTLTTCNTNAELFFCAQFFPDCPYKGWTRQPCRQLCETVQNSCQLAYDTEFSENTWPWDCSNYHDTGGDDELCLHPEGGNFCYEETRDEMCDFLK